ncbi:MAG: carbohydrate ABC transporter substrate-binding protein [Spirochaetales bacterium]|nr:carbohydrate ABC transporter substrate-binding protein [Spirochaetales bacterium]
MTKKKVIVMLAIGFVLIAGVFLTRNILTMVKTKSGIKLIVPYTKNEADIFNKYLLNFYDKENDVDTSYITSEFSFKENIENFEVKGDVFYSLYSSQISDIARTSENIHFYKDMKFSIPKVFYSLSGSEKFYSYVPITFSPWGFYYNKELFTDLGLEEPKNFNELIEIANILKDKDVVPFSMLQDLRWPMTIWFDYLNIRINGAEFHNSLLIGLSDFRDKKVLNVYSEIYSMINKGYFTIVPKESNWLEMIDMVVNKKSAMILGAGFVFDNTNDEDKKNMGWFPFPLVNKQDHYSEIVSTSGYFTGISNVAHDFIEYSLSKQGQIIISDYSNYYPINKEILLRKKREDLLEAYDHIVKAKSVIPSFERNTNPEISQQIKTSLNLLFRINDVNEISGILEKLESVRLEAQ